MQGYKIKLAEMGGKGNNAEEGDKPFLVKNFMRLKGHLKVLRNMTEEENQHRRQLMVKSKAVDYFMGYARGLIFGSVMWCQRRIVSEARELTHF